MKPERKSVLLNLDLKLVQRVDEAARFIQMTRSAYLRESIVRNLRFFDNFEKRSHEAIKQQAKR